MHPDLALQGLAPEIAHPDCPGCSQQNPTGGQDPAGNFLCINCYATAQFTCGRCARELGLDELGCEDSLSCSDCCGTISACI